MQVVEPQTSEHDLRVLNQKMSQVEIFLPSFLKEIQTLKIENQRLQSELDKIKAEIREIKAKR